MCSALCEHDAVQTCRRCGQPFSFAGWFFAQKGLSVPRHCFDCRQARRNERDRAGIPRSVHMPPED